MPYTKRKGYKPCWSIEDSDVWSFDMTLALFIADGLDKLAAVDVGHPVCFMDDPDEWPAMLRRQAEVFRAYGRADICGDEADARHEAMVAGLEWLKVWVGHLWY